MIASFDIGEKNFAYCIGTINTLIKWHRFDVCESKNQHITQSCLEISKILSNEDWNECDKIIIEQQIRCNVRAQRVSQHVWTWFSILYPKIPLKFVSPSNKTRVFGKVYSSSKQRKIWAVTKVLEILTERGDETNIKILNAEKKRDDMADTYLQLIAHEMLNLKINK